MKSNYDELDYVKIKSKKKGKDKPVKIKEIQSKVEKLTDIINKAQREIVELQCICPHTENDKTYVIPTRRTSDKTGARLYRCRACSAIIDTSEVTNETLAESIKNIQNKLDILKLSGIMNKVPPKVYRKAISDIEFRLGVIPDIDRAMKSHGNKAKSKSSSNEIWHSPRSSR